MQLTFRFFYFVTGITLVLGFVSVDDPLQKILAQLSKYSSDYPQEKVYLHFDKPIYAAGDTVYFKAYVVLAEKNQLSALSKTLYLELIDRDYSVIRRLTL
ncbi:MAG: TonB-dependent receptor, partial [Sphingobacteriaceae bacterium]